MTDERKLRKIVVEDFKRIWHAIIFLYAELHPDSALAHGEERCIDEKFASKAPRAKMLSERYAQSGWPVALAPVLAEARRRYESGELTAEEFYCNAASLAALRHASSGEFSV